MNNLTIIAYLPDLSGIKLIVKIIKDNKELYYFALPPNYQINESQNIDEVIVNSAILKHSYIPLNKTVEIKESISQTLKEVAKELEISSN